MIDINREIMNYLAKQLADKMDLDIMGEFGMFKEWTMAKKIFGYEIIENGALVDWKTRKIERTWMERLFKKPLFRKFRTESYSVPSNKVVIINKPPLRQILCHPDIAKKLIEDVKNG